MNIDNEIRQINNQQEFVELCNTIFIEKYKEDFQIIDGSRSDQGNDGYITSQKCILAIYCPAKPENRTDQDYRDKIHADLKKAKDLRDSGKYKIEKWTFITPGKLSSSIVGDLMNKAKEFGFEGNHLDATFLADELCRNRYLLVKFPYLHIPDIDYKLDEILKELKKPHKEEIVFPANNVMSEKKDQEYEQSADLKRVFEILKNKQTDTSKVELKTIFYKTTDKIAQTNIIFGLLHWHDPLEDKDEDMVEWCEQGINIASILGNKGLRAIFLSNKGLHLSDIWAREDMTTAYTIKAGNAIGIPIISEEQKQSKIKELHTTEEQFLNAFKEAVDIAIELKNASVLAQVCMLMGQAAGSRYIHLNALGANIRAGCEKTIAKRALLHAKELYSAIGYELGIGYALHNLAIQLHTFGEKKEAAELNKTVTEIANKHGDKSLLQTSAWLEESLKMNRIPDYVHGERRERKL